jgi:hypothetical protein
MPADDLAAPLGRCEWSWRCREVPVLQYFLVDGSISNNAVILRD